jgi:hypothetical protein
MKTSLPCKKTLHLLFLAIVINCSAYAQFAEMVFQNPALESGTFGADGSTYRFSNIAKGLDAVITIKSRSDASVVLSNMDTTGSIGYDNAFQPVLGIPGTAPANTTWWMDFNMSLYQAGTMIPVMPMQFYATGLDIDGDGQTINEWSEMYKIEKIDSALVNSLTFKQIAPYFQGYDYRIEGIIANSPGIDTSAKNVMAKFKYSNKQSINFRIGASTAGSTSSAAMRLNSIWFSDLYIGTTLPLKLISFTAEIENNVVGLKWITASEENLKKFVIERSYDNKNFSEVDAVLPYGHPADKNNYIFLDKLSENSPTTVYYRLHSIDINGKGEYSETRIITRQKISELNISAYPNPVMNNLLVTIPSAWQKKNVMFELLSVNGQLAKIFNTTNTGQTEVLNVNNIAPGPYFLNASCDGKIVRGKIIKN